MNKKLIVIVILVIIIIGIAVGAYFIMGSSSSTTSNKQSPPQVSQPQVIDPCSGYNDTDKNLSDECIISLWKKGGCPSDGIRQIAYYKNNKAVMTKLQISNDAKAWAMLNDIDHRTDCYGIDKSKWPLPLPAQYLRHL